MENEERLKAALADRYQIEREIGSGGMATVYLAQDLKHDRKVAVKVLKPELAAVVGTERFLAEIRTTANLSHPHILPLHDSGEADGFLFYVMPYVEGESLRQKLDQDGQLSVEEAVRVAGHVANALDYAHRQGVIHRDVKPSNILFEDEQPVMTDFGIALAISAAGEGRLTETGLSLGTPYYMSPEQAAGDQTPTAASDVYSLGCVLYEMLTGEPPHTGTSAQAILGKILLAEVTRPTKLRRTIPANVEGAVLKALERLPADRFESVAELAAALENRAFRHGVGVGAGAAEGLWNPLSISSAVVALLALGVAGMVFFRPEPPPPPVLRQQIHPPGMVDILEWGRQVALAPDGSSMVYADSAGLQSGWQLWVKERGSVDGRPLSGTVNALDVVYSPDGQWIVYKAGNDLVKRPIQGAGTETLLEGVATGRMAISWMTDGTILCEMADGHVLRIPEDGGLPPDTVYDSSPDTPTWAYALPGEHAALLVRCKGGDCQLGSYLDVVDLRAHTAWTLQDEVLRAWYVETGHLVWVRRDGVVFATPFDLDRLEWSGGHEPLFEGVSFTSRIANMVLARNGTALFLEGPAQDMASNQLSWVDRHGQREPMDPQWATGPFGTLALSPDGQLLAVAKTEESGSQISVKVLPDGPLTRLTTGPGLFYRPTWSPDGATLAYVAPSSNGYHIRGMPSDGRSAGAYEVLLELDKTVPQALFTPDGKGLVFRVGLAGGLADIGFLDLNTGEVNDSLLATEFDEFGMALSPDGRWLAYTSNITGRREVFVRPFPDVDSDFTPVSRDGGNEAMWAPNGGELFFRSEDGWMTAVTYSADSVFIVENWERLFDARPFGSDVLGRGYEISPLDGRFLMVLADPVADSGGGPAPRMIQIQSFFTELEERVGEGH